MTAIGPNFYDRLRFFLATDALKETRRANWIYSSARFETVAEHNWHTLLLAMLLADAAPEDVDHNHVRDLLIVHDLVEVYAGDTPIWDDVARATEAEREHAAGERLMALLPDDIFPRFDPLWREYQAQETAEARFGRAIDTLHPVLMSWSEGGQGHSNGAITPAKLIERKRPTIERYPLLWELVTHVIQQAVDRGSLPSDAAVRRRDVAREADGSTMSGLHERLAFFLATDRLKEERRANFILAHPRQESVAEHCWHVSLLAMLLADCASGGVDIDRVADLLIVHDLVEVYAGDTRIDDLEGQSTAAVREAAAATQLLALLPEPSRLRFARLIDEFQRQQSEEARFARAIDTLHPTMLTWVDGAHEHPDHEHAPVSPSIVIERKRVMLERYPALWQLVLRIVQGAVDRGALPPDDMIQRTGK